MWRSGRIEHSVIVCVGNCLAGGISLGVIRVWMVCKAVRSNEIPKEKAEREED